MLGAHQGGARSRSPSASPTSAARRSRPAEDEIDIEDLIADQQMVITITHSRLHQVAAARHLPPAAARRRRRHRDGHEGRRLHRAPLRVLVARLPAVLLQPRQGLPLEGLRAARGVAHGQGPRARQRPAAARGRADPVRALHARLHRDEVPRLRDAQRHGQEDRVRSPTTRRSRPTASSRSTSATTTSCVAVRARRPGRRDPHGLRAPA